MYRERPERYSTPAIVMHWTSVTLVFLLLALGWYLEDLPNGPNRGWYIAVHKSIGITLFVVAVLRLSWRLSHRPPEFPGILPFWQRASARFVHGLLYVSILIQPLSGYLSASFSGYPMRLYGLDLYTWGWKDPGLNEFFSNVHAGSAIALTVLIVIHIGAVLFHTCVRRDSIWRRMWPSRTKF